MNYVATFHTHLAALRTFRALEALGVEARMAPVPRRLSSSCGTCVRFLGPEEYAAEPDPNGELEQLVRETEEGYEVIFHGE